LRWVVIGLAVSLLSQFVETINAAEEAQKAKIKEQNDKQSTDSLLRNILRVEMRFVISFQPVRQNTFMTEPLAAA
jgi:hypothetical protein